MQIACTCNTLVVAFDARFLRENMSGKDKVVLKSLVSLITSRESHYGRTELKLENFAIAKRELCNDSYMLMQV